MPYVYAVPNGALTPKAGAAHHDEKPSIIGLISMESSNEHESRLRILADRHVARRRRRDARHVQRHVHCPRRNNLRRGAALCVYRFRLRRPRGTALSLVYRPGTGNSAGHHHLDGAVDRCASGAVAPAIAPWLLLRLALGSLVGLPLGLVAFRYADPFLVRAAAGAMIFGFAILMVVSRRRSGQPGQGKHWTAFAMSPGLDLAAGAVSGIAGALVGQPGPPVLIYLLLAGTAARTVRATLLAFFALSYGVTLASHTATIGISAPTWLAAGILIPFAFLGGLAGRPIGDRIGAEAFAKLAIALLAVAGAYTLGAAAVAFATA